MRVSSGRGMKVLVDEPPASSQLGLSYWVNGPCLQSHSISEVMRNVTVGLHRIGCEVAWESKEPPATYPIFRGLLEDLRGAPQGKHVQLHWGVPEEKHKVHGTAAVVSFDCSDSFRPWVPQVVETYQSAAVDFLVSFSAGCRDRWIEAGVPEEKVVLVPLGVDRYVYRPDGPHHDLSGVRWFGGEPEAGHKVFLVAGYLQHRKGVPETVEAFCRAFAGRRDVALVIKTVAKNWGNKQDMHIRQALRHAPGRPPVGQLVADLTHWEFASLLRRADCVVNAHRMEGFGMIPLQAMACGTQTIVTAYHGPLEYADEGNSWLLPVTGEVPAPTGERGVPVGVMWADYDLDTLAGLMQAAEAAPKDPAAGLATAEAFSWEATAGRLVRVVEQRVGPVRTRPRRWYQGGLLSVIIPVRNTAEEVLRRTLTTLLELRGEAPIEVLLFDDASDEATAAMLKALAEEFPQVRVTRSDRRVGSFVARRRLCQQAKGEWICILDSDLDFSETRRDAFAVLEEEWRRGACIVHPLLTYPDGTVESAGGMVDERDMTASKHRFRGEAAEGVALETCDVAYGSSAFQFFHASLLEQVQYCNQYFPAYFGDPDFCYLARTATGKPVRYFPAVRVTHHAHSWTAAHRGDTRYAESRMIFQRRWLTQTRHDLQVQDNTGALPRAGGE